MFLRSLDGPQNGIQEGLIIDGFPEKNEGSQFPCKVSRPRIIVGRNSNDRDPFFSRCQFL